MYFALFKQNICSARVFLNAFGLILENVDDINEFSKIKIFDKNSNVVGNLYFDNGKVIINAEYNNCTLKANYNISKLFGFKDIECGNALFCEWSSKIYFKADNDKIKLNGEFLINSSADSALGIRCTCHPLIICDISNKGITTLKIQRDGRTFGIENKFNNYHEIIDIIPFDDWFGYLVHDIKKGDWDKQKGGYPYRRFASIRRSANVGKERHKLRKFLSEEEFSDTKYYKEESVPKIKNDNSREAVIQKGLLMKEIDPEMFKKMSETMIAHRKEVLQSEKIKGLLQIYKAQ